MWFKNIQIFEISSPLNQNVEAFEAQLEKARYRPCGASLPMSLGWSAPVGNSEDALLAHPANQCFLFSLRVEEKIMPPAVIAQQVEEKVAEMRVKLDRKISKREKDSLKDEIYHTMLPRAFSKMSRINAYIDLKQSWLIIDSTSTSKVDLFLSYLKKTMPQLELQAPELKKLSTVMASWLKHQTQPQSIAIEKNCVLQDPNQKGRVIRATQQDLGANAIQSLLKDGCEVSQMAVCWSEQIRFKLREDFALIGLRFEDEVLALAKDNYTETPEQELDASFMIMSETLRRLMQDLLGVLVKEKAAEAIAA